MVAARITQMQSFMALMQMAIMPMYFLSGALFPVSGLPQWLTILNRLDPLTYAVDPMRRAVFAHLHISAAARHALDPGVTWWGWHVPGLVEAAVVALLGLLMLGDRDRGVQPRRVTGGPGLSAGLVDRLRGDAQHAGPGSRPRESSARRIPSASVALSVSVRRSVSGCEQAPQEQHRPDPARRPHARRAPFDAALDRVDRLRQRRRVAHEAGHLLGHQLGRGLREARLARDPCRGSRSRRSRPARRSAPSPCAASRSAPRRPPWRPCRGPSAARARRPRARRCSAGSRGARRSAPITARSVRHTPSRLTARVRSTCSTGALASVPVKAIPAFAIATSMPPKRSTVARPRARAPRGR